METIKTGALLRSRLSHVNLNVVKKLVNLALFFSIGFAILFLTSTGLRFLTLRVEWIRALSREQDTMLIDLITAARWALSVALYGGVLIGLSNAARKEVFAPEAILCVMLLAISYTYGIGLMLKSWENIPFATTPTQSLGKPGLILANSARSTSTVIVLLKGPSQAGGSRVVATPGKPLLYQEEFAGKDLSLYSLPPAPFSDDNPWFLKSLAIDLRLNAEILQQCINHGLLSFLMYAGALIFLLCSLMFIFKLSAWPLANFIVGCLVFRGILALEIFFNTPEMLEIFDSYLHNFLPLSTVTPLIFCVVGVLASLYTFLAFLAKRQSYAR